MKSLRIVLGLGLFATALFPVLSASATITGLSVTTMDFSNGYVLESGFIDPNGATEVGNAWTALNGSVTTYRVWADASNPFDTIFFAGSNAVLNQPLILNSNDGAFINSPLGGLTPPDTVLMTGFPDLAWDTWLTLGGASTNTIPTLFGPFDTSNILGGLAGNVLGTNTGLGTNAPGVIPIPDGAGGWRVLLGQFSVAATGSEGISGWIRLNGFSGGFFNGVPFDEYLPFNSIPAPGALLLLGLAGLTGSRRRQRKTLPHDSSSIERRNPGESPQSRSPGSRSHRRYMLVPVVAASIVLMTWSAPARAGVTALCLTTVDFSSGYVLADGTIDVTNAASVSVGWSGLGNSVTTFRLWAEVTNPFDTISLAGSGGVGQPLIIDSNDGAFINSSSPLNDIHPPSVDPITFLIAPDLAWDTWLTLGTADSISIFPGGFSDTNPASLGGLAGNVNASNTTWSLTSGSGSVVSDGAGGWRILLGQFSVAATGSEGITGWMSVSGLNGGMPHDQFEAYLPFDCTPVPGPGALALLGLAGLAGGRRRRSREA